MKKGNISFGVAIAIVALLFAGTGIALAGTADVDEIYFYQESMVTGTGLVMVDKDISTFPWQPTQNLETNLHIHGCGDYEVDQVLKSVVVNKYATIGGAWTPQGGTPVWRPGNFVLTAGVLVWVPGGWVLSPGWTQPGTFLRPVSQTIDYCEDAEMTFKPVTIQSGSMTLIDDDTSVKWKEDLCIKNHQIGTAMRAKYTDADYIKKTIESNVTCVEPYRTNNQVYPEDPIFEGSVSGYGIAKMDILSTVSGTSHIGVVVKDTSSQTRRRVVAPIRNAHTTILRVSEDYIGNFTIDKHMTVKMNKPGPIGNRDVAEWLPCPFGPTGLPAEFYEGDC